MIHPLEKELNADAKDILEAISRGFRAKADAKGKLAELYLSRKLDILKQQGKIDDYLWHDKDRLPDFEIIVSSKKIIMECKNVRSGTVKNLFGPDWAKVELQKTRNGIDAQGNKTRGYSRDLFDILAACTFNQTGKWDYRFISADRLLSRKDLPTILEIFQTVYYSDVEEWTGNLAGLIPEVFLRRGRPLGQTPHEVLSGVNP